jgi:hypothetical protein
MLVFVKLSFDVPQHRNVKGSHIILPIEFDATIKIARPILGELIFCFDAFDEMICMLFSNIFHAKVVNNYSECDGAFGMFSQTRGIGTLKISVGEKTLTQQFICQITRLGEVPHCAVHLKVN